MLLIGRYTYVHTDLRSHSIWETFNVYHVPKYCVLCTLFAVLAFSIWSERYFSILLCVHSLFSLSLLGMVSTLFTLCMDTFADRSFIYLRKQHVVCRINTKFVSDAFLMQRFTMFGNGLEARKNGQISYRCSEQTITEELKKITFKNEIKAKSLLCIRCINKKNEKNQVTPPVTVTKQRRKNNEQRK